MQMKILLSAGHSGVFEHFYATAGKRSPEPPPKGIFEGDFNRKMCAAIAKFEDARLQYAFLNPGLVDVPMKSKKEYIEKFIKEFPNSILLEIHANAASNVGWHPATGRKIFHQKNLIWNKTKATRSKDLATMLDDELTTRITKCPLQGHFIKSRGIQPRMFSMLVVPCVANLIEFGFMTSKEDVECLKSHEWIVNQAEGVHMANLKYWEKYFREV